MMDWQTIPGILLMLLNQATISQLAAPIQAGATVANVCQMGNIAYKTGKKLNWDKKTGTFNDAAANKLIQPVYHNNYKLPKI